MKKIVILYSGGLDSFLMYRLAKVENPDANVSCVFYAHGQDSEQAEIESLPSFVTVRKIDWLNDAIKPVCKKSDPFAGAIYIPGRNLIFSALAACQELADEVWMGTVWDEDNQQATDKNEHFRIETSKLISYVLSPFVDNVTVKFPFVERKWTKENSVGWALKNGIDANDLKKTISCWHQKGDKPCGECKQCSKRMLVFGLNGLEEDYVISPLKSEIQQNNILEYLVKYNSTDFVPNADELNMVDMIIRYFTSNDYFNDVSTWMQNVRFEITKILNENSKSLETFRQQRKENLV